MKLRMFRLIGILCLLILNLFMMAGCEPDFYLSESEAAAYAGAFADEATANNFVSNSLPGQILDVEFNNSRSLPGIQSTNLVSLMRNYTTLGFMEQFNHQIQLDRLNEELQAQIEPWIRSELQLYMGGAGADASLKQLSAVKVYFLSKPQFTFAPDRQSIVFNLNVRLFIHGTIEVNALDPFLNWLFGINGTYPLVVDINNFGMKGAARFASSFADGGDIEFSISPRPGSITVNDAGVSIPSQVKQGVKDLVAVQLSRQLRTTFHQSYKYFALSGLHLTPSTANAPSRLEYTYQPRPETARPMLHIVARKSDGKLYHMRKTEGSSSVIGTAVPFPSLSSRIESEPALFASATDQLELAATTTNNELVYAHWRDETWGDQATIPASATKTGFRGKPAIAASAPGQVEIFAAGRDGNLWQASYFNGRWATLQTLPLAGFSAAGAPPYRDPVAVHTGNKIVVVFVNGSSRLAAIVYDMESGLYGQPVSLPTAETTPYAPAAAASGDGRVDVVYVGAGSNAYHRALDIDAQRFTRALMTGISLAGSEIALGAKLNASPSLVCSGFRQLEFIGRDTNNHLLHNHFVGPSLSSGFLYGRQISPGWQGWTDLNGNFAGTLTFENMTAFSAASTFTGKIAVASITAPSLLDNDSNQFIFYNTYDSERFGTQPWKTVLWRGYEQAGTQRFIGQPALAVTDRNSAVLNADNTYALWGARVAESNAASFSSFSNTQIATPPSDPVITTSVAGRVDAVEIGLDGQLRHIRRIGGNPINSATLPMPAGQLVRGAPAVAGYGNGQLEIVAVTQSNTMFHWRYQNGTWSIPAQLSGSVHSQLMQPILVHAGAGQLVLMAIGSDRHLYLWSFKNGSWSASKQVPTPAILAINPAMFGMPAASSWGNGSIDLALADNAGALYHGRIGPAYFAAGIITGLTPSRAFSAMGATASDTPIVTSISPTRINVLATVTDGVLYSNWSSWDNLPYILANGPGIVWNHKRIGGGSLLMGGVAKLGSNELVAAGMDLKGRVVLSRFTSAGWSQFQPVMGQSPQNLQIPPRYRPAITSFGR